METSTHLPTTVDFGNNLVNYIEVSGDDAQARALTLGATPPKSATEAQALPSRQPSKTELETGEKPPAKKVIDPLDAFTGVIPQYLADFDQPEDSRPYQLSVGALDKLPNPPALPGFLSKPIMNANALIKDDNSVLNMPNHTVLNHLATSSIKNNVLAVSATTRYRNKVGPGTFHVMVITFCIEMLTIWAVCHDHCLQTNVRGHLVPLGLNGKSLHQMYSRGRESGARGPIQQFQLAYPQLS